MLKISRTVGNGTPVALRKGKYIRYSKYSKFIGIFQEASEQVVIIGDNVIQRVHLPRGVVISGVTKVNVGLEKGG